MLISQNKKQLVLNSALELGEDLTVEKKGKGRKFVSRFIEAGVAHYQEFGDVLITKETLDKFIQTMVGCPLIINHKEITDKNADKERVGVISNVWYNEADGWYYCDGIIWDAQAIDLVKNQGWSVSCTYDFVSDNQEKLHNGKKIDLEFIDGNFLHLALVPNPRYERANIVINSKDEINKDKENSKNWNEDEHPRKKDGTFAEVLEKVSKEDKEDKEDKKEKSPQEKMKETDGARIAFEYNQEKQNSKNKAQNRKDFTIMTVLKELESFIKGIVDNACDKDKKEDKVENIDKRKLIDEVGGILKGEVTEEVWRTVIGKLEKIAYDPSETDKADNKCKNEDDEEEELKKEKFEEEKEIADNKKAKNEDKEDKKQVKNSMDDVRNAIMGGNIQVQTRVSYVSRADRLKAGEDY